MRTRTELVFALTSAVGTDIGPLVTALESYLSQDYGYEVLRIRVSEDIIPYLNVPTKLVENPPHQRYLSRMDAGSDARNLYGNDVLARVVISKIEALRSDKAQEKPRAYIVWQLKHPAEVNLLRQVYGPGFFLLGVFQHEAGRLKRLEDFHRIPEAKAQELIEKDLDEPERKFGQKSSSTFERSDVFLLSEGFVEQLHRFINLVFGDPFTTPTRDEHAMFIAYSASLRSAELGRQVGAVVLSSSKELVSVGANEVPRAGGGLYWAGEEPDARDFTIGYDCNHAKKDQLRADLVAILGTTLNANQEAALTELLKQVTEFGRAVHAEMEALLACGRNGVSPCKGTLFSTTFPCHLCARHVVASGISRVVFIEPYPKSLATELHEDSIVLCGPDEVIDDDRVRFEPFVGVGPRRFLDLFSVSLSSGHEVQRKRREGGYDTKECAADHEDAEWKKAAVPRVPLTTMSYLEREKHVIAGGEAVKPITDILREGTE